MICQACDPSCSVCFGTLSSNCTACASTYFLNVSATTCQKTCASGYFADAATATCLICDPKCITCVTNSTNCLLCSNNLLVFQGNCYAHCPSPYFGDLVQRGCRARCPYGNPAEPLLTRPKWASLFGDMH